MAPLIYLDYNATTPTDERVLEAMLPYFGESFWNAASAHAGGRDALAAVDEARQQVAHCVGARPSEVVWTSGATEANNLALKGVLSAAPAARNRLVYAATEHKAVLDTAEALRELGYPTTRLDVDREGAIAIEQLRNVLEMGDTALVSVMTANNETGAVADIASLARVAHEGGALFHTDATQALGKLALSVRDMDVDLASFSAHKAYGPKGSGALFVSRRVRSIAPILHGGGHENGLRSGTLNVPGIVGFGEACRLITERSDGEHERQRQLVDRLITSLAEALDGISLIGAMTTRLPNTANVHVAGADSEAVMANAPRLAMSSGSACTSRLPQPSHVLLAMGLTPVQASECLRISVGRGTTTEQIDEAVGLLQKSISFVRKATR